MIRESLSDFRELLRDASLFSKTILIEIGVIPWLEWPTLRLYTGFPA